MAADFFHGHTLGLVRLGWFSCAADWPSRGRAPRRSCLARRAAISTKRNRFVHGRSRLDRFGRGRFLYLFLKQF